jgi:signal transduction histidine kinase/DNA-binding response OmpR family regulator
MPLPQTNLRAILLLTITWWGTLAASQELRDHETISTTQGLSQGMIYALLQDKEGFIWIGTKEGLNRYDGYNFKVFTNDPYDPQSISSNNIRTLFEDSKGRIWAGALDAGMNVYDKKTGRFHRIMHRPGDPSGLSGNRVLSATIELPDGRIMLAPADNRINIISLPDDYFGKDSIPVITHVDLPGNGQAFGIGKDDKGKIWVGCTDKRIYLFDPATSLFEMICDGKVFTAALAHAGTKLWGSRDVFSMDSSFVVRPFDTTNKMVPGLITKTPADKIIFEPFGEPPTGVGNSYFYDISKWSPGMPLSKAISNTFTGSLINLQLVMVDRSGIIWAGTSGFGLNKYNLDASRFHHLLPDFSVRNILPIGKDILFLGGWKNDQWIASNGKLIKNPLPEELIANWYMNFLVSKTGDYWIWKGRQFVKGLFARTGSLLRYDRNGKKIAEFPLPLKGYDEKQPMLEDNHGNIWMCGGSGAFVRANPATGKISQFTINNDPSRPMMPYALSTAFYEDSEGILWIGTEEGFARIEFRENSDEPVIKWYKNDAASNNSLNYNYVSCFLDDPSDKNYLWVCTKGGGLNRLDKSTGNFFHLTSKQGLPNDVVYGIVTDTAGNIWGSTNKGLFCLFANKEKDDKKWVFRNFTKSDGLQSEEFNTNAYAKLPDGRLAFGGVNGLNIFNPSEVLSAGFSPNVFLTSIQVGNQAVYPGDKTGILRQTIENTSSITLTHLQDILTLEFSSLDFAAPGENKYRYQLVGVDKEWVESGTRRTATYLHLPPGNYVFKLQGSNSHGTWSDKIAELKITVLPPWWRTWWAYGVYLLLFLLAVRVYFKFTVNRAKLRSQLNFEQLEAKRVKELDTVKTQLYTNITHEFRTPLTVIMGMAQQVINKPEEHFRNGMDMIVRNGQHLLNLVNEMLDLSKLETGKMQLQLINGDVINFLRYIVESFHSLAESQQKQVHFLTDIDAMYVAYDPEKIRQIITNLMSNALKFTPEKGNVYISINQNVLPNDGPNLTLIIKVKDTGIGIPEDQLQYIFDRFHQLDNSHTRKAEGTGIGLALTKELVKLMEGEIMVKSPPAGASKGSEFTVILPMIKVPATEEPTDYSLVKETHKPLPVTEVSNAITSSPEDQNGQQPIILLVEDNADVVAYTASCLPDYRLAVAKDGREGLEIALEIIPDLIITDVMMPFMDGFELSSRLKKDEHTSHIPIIMLTAKADIESKLEGLQQGADAYLEKPFHREELLLRIKKLLELRQHLQQYYLKKAGLVALQETQPLVPTAEKKIEDAFVKKVREVVEKNLADAHFTIEQLCKLLFMSHSQLHRKLDALTGCSPNKFIRIIRLQKAKALLTNSDDSIASVALDCGYNDPGYFARVFKQEYGVTPQEWRTQNKYIHSSSGG